MQAIQVCLCAKLANSGTVTATAKCAAGLSRVRRRGLHVFAVWQTGRSSVLLDGRCGGRSYMPTPVWQWCTPAHRVSEYAKVQCEAQKLAVSSDSGTAIDQGKPKTGQRFCAGDQTDVHSSFVAHQQHTSVRVARRQRSHPQCRKTATTRISRLEHKGVPAETKTSAAGVQGRKEQRVLAAGLTKRFVEVQ